MTVSNYKEELDRTIMAPSAETTGDSRVSALLLDHKRSIGVLGATSQRRSIAEWFLLARVLVFAAAVPYLLRLKLSRVARALEPGQEPFPVDESKIQKITAYVETAIRRGNPLVRPGCLTRGLTRYHFFRRSGMDVALCFGMGRVNNEVVGHCWLVRDGEPYLEPQDEDPRNRYAEMYRISRTISLASSTAAETAGLGKFSS